MRNFLKLRKNRSFEYKPRYYEGQGNPYKIEPKLEKYRTTVHKQRGLKNKFSNAVNDLQNEGDKNLKLRFLYIIDFDLSIFFQS